MYGGMIDFKDITDIVWRKGSLVSLCTSIELLD